MVVQSQIKYNDDDVDVEGAGDGRGGGERGRAAFALSLAEVRRDVKFRVERGLPIRTAQISVLA